MAGVVYRNAQAKELGPNNIVPVKLKIRAANMVDLMAFEGVLGMIDLIFLIKVLYTNTSLIYKYKTNMVSPSLVLGKHRQSKRVKS